MKTYAERLWRHLKFLVKNLFRKNPPMPLRDVVAKLRKKDPTVDLDLVAHWYQDQNTLQWGNFLHNLGEQLERLLLQRLETISADQVRQIVIQFLLVKGLVGGDDKLTFQAISRDQTEVSLDHDARDLELKGRMVAVAQERVLIDQRKLDPPKLLKIANDPEAGLSPETIQKIERELRLL